MSRGLVLTSWLVPIAAIQGCVAEGDELLDEATEGTTESEQTTGDLEDSTGAMEETSSEAPDEAPESIGVTAVPVLQLSVSPIKRFDFSWAPVEDATHYQLFESASPGADYTQLGGDIYGESLSVPAALHLRFQASYVLRSCDDSSCTDSEPLTVTDSLAQAVGYVKASNTGAEDRCGQPNMAFSGDGSTLVMGCSYEDSNATGVGGNQANNLASNSGAVYVFVRDAMGAWSQQAYIKASNTEASDYFGGALALSDSGDTLAVGAYMEDGGSSGVGGNQANNIFTTDAGAAYVFTRSGGVWSQQAYIKASNTQAQDFFGQHLTISGDGNTLAVAAPAEDSSATGINGAQNNNYSSASGAVYVFTRSADVWSQQAYVKASNPGPADLFGSTLALDGNGDTLVVGSWDEDSNGVGPFAQLDNSVAGAGAAYVFTRSAMGTWSQQAYLKASNPGAGDYFGYDVALSDSGDTLAVSAVNEDSNASGVGGNQADNSVSNSGALYVFGRSMMGAWSQQAYIKATNPGVSDWMGRSIALSGDGNVLASGVDTEDGGTTGIGGNQADESANAAGAVQVFVRDVVGTWSPRAYVKASNTAPADMFGSGVALSGDGNTLAVGAYGEDGNATGIGGDPSNNSLTYAGAVYLY